MARTLHADQGNGGVAVLLWDTHAAFTEGKIDRLGQVSVAKPTARRRMLEQVDGPAGLFAHIRVTVWARPFLSIDDRSKVSSGGEGNGDGFAAVER